MSHESSTETLIAALRVLAVDIQSEDGVANAAVAEAADRLERYDKGLKSIRDHIENLGPAKGTRGYWDGLTQAHYDCGRIAEVTLNVVQDE